MKMKKPLLFFVRVVMALIAVPIITVVLFVSILKMLSAGMDVNRSVPASDTTIIAFTIAVIAGAGVYVEVVGRDLSVSQRRVADFLFLAITIGSAAATFVNNQEVGVFKMFILAPYALGILTELIYARFVRLGDKPL